MSDIMKNFSVTINVWRQNSASDKGSMVSYPVNDVSPAMSFLEMLDVLNEDLIKKGDSPIVVESDCREGICGCCGLVIDGNTHGPDKNSTVCQLHM
ncbi:MAG: hypothetical protein KAJ48_09825, partial [Elusimicrobiales bacterium]|nr:hypothetical protein [Elusimicrobiales bacterium]